MPGSDLSSILGAPELAPPAPAPVVAPVQQAVPPLPNEPDANLLARAALAEGDQNNPESWRNVAGVVLNRAAKTGKSVAGVLSEPGQFEAFGNGHIQSVDPNSPAFKAALGAVQGVKAGDVPYDSFYQPTIVAARGVKPPFDPAQGTKIGTQLFGNGYADGAPSASPLANSLGLTPDEQAQLNAHTAPAPATPAGQTQGSAAQFNYGPGFKPMSAAAVTTFQRIDKERGLDPKADEGSPNLPYYAAPGVPVPTTPGIHWVDADGTEHINPGGFAAKAESVLGGLGQGTVMDTAASASRLTNGGLAVGDPMMSALSQAQGGPSALEFSQAAQQGAQQQQRQYALSHINDPYAQTGRFVGQALPATAAAAAVPEAELPAALGGRVVSTGLTNALRGAAAVTPSVGVNPNQSVVSQLAGGALAGVVAPAVLGAPGKVTSALTGMGRTVSPDVATLADAAQTKYGIPLRSGQVMGANGDRNAATADSNLLGSSPAVRDNNIAQRQAFMKGVTETYGDPSGDVSPDALQAAKDRIGSVMNDVATRSNIADATPVLEKLGAVLSDAKSVLPEGEVTPLQNLAHQVASTIQPDGSISGASYQALTKKGGVLDASISRANSPYPSQIKEALDDALQNSATPEDAQALQQARWQYKNLQTVAKLAPKADVSGIISPALLRGAVGTSFKNQAFQGAGDLGELAQIGQTFMKEPPNSFTANRLRDLALPTLAGVGVGELGDFAAKALSHPEVGIPALASAGLGAATKIAADAIKQNCIGGSASGIIERSLPGTPGTIRSALSGVKQLTRPVEIPLSALAGVRGLQSFAPAPAVHSP